MDDSIFDNIPYDYSIFDPQVQGPIVEGFENTGNTIALKGEELTLRFVSEINTIEEKAPILTIKEQ